MDPISLMPSEYVEDSLENWISGFSGSNFPSTFSAGRFVGHPPETS
jgi:hypothetical protein